MKKELLAIKDFLDESYLKYNTNLCLMSFGKVFKIYQK